MSKKELITKNSQTPVFPYLNLDPGQAGVAEHRRQYSDAAQPVKHGKWTPTLGKKVRVRMSLAFRDPLRSS